MALALNNQQRLICHKTTKPIAKQNFQRQEKKTKTTNLFKKIFGFQFPAKIFGPSYSNIFKLDFYTCRYYTVLLNRYAGENEASIRGHTLIGTIH